MNIKKLLLIISLLCLVFLFSCNNEIENIEEPIDETAIRTLTYEISNPLMGRINGTLTQELTYNDTSTSVKVNEKPGYKFIGWSDGLTDYSRTDTNIKEDTVITAIFDYEYRTMPILEINTIDFMPVMSKTDFIDAEVTFAYTNGDRRFESLPAEIRGRGNATWGMEKKSYRLKFNDRIDLIEGENNDARTWVLLANHCDQTMLRNHTAFKLGQTLIVPCSTDSMFVELYFNGKYDGVYQIVDQVQVNENRVNVDEKRTDNSIGFLIELDRYFEGTENVDYVVVNNLFYSIKSEIHNPEQIQYLKNYLEQIEAAIRGNDEEACNRLIDMDSCVATYILQELMRNIDVGWSSFFMYIEEDYGKMYFGPPWDFDLAAGNDHRLDNGSFEGIYVGNRRSGFDQRHRWFPILVEYDWYNELVKDMWNNKKDDIIITIDEVYNFGKENTLSFNRNFEAWPIWGHRINQEPEHIMALNTYTKHLDYLIEWMYNRYYWLDDYFNSDN